MDERLIQQQEQELAKTAQVQLIVGAIGEP